MRVCMCGCMRNMHPHHVFTTRSQQPPSPLPPLLSLSLPISPWCPPASIVPMFGADEECVGFAGFQMLLEQPTLRVNTFDKLVADPEMIAQKPSGGGVTTTKAMNAMVAEEKADPAVEDA